MADVQTPRKGIMLLKGSMEIMHSLVFWIIFLAVFMGFGFSMLKLFPKGWETLANGTLGTMAAVISTWAILKWEKRKFSDIGLTWEGRTMLRFLLGFGIGLLIFGVILGALVLFSRLTIQKSTISMGTWDVIKYFAIIPLALMEEILFRAYPQVTLNRRFSFRFTQILIAIAFALYHILSGWNVAAAFWGPAVWAFVFGLAARRSGGISMPLGIHAALNVFQPLVGMGSGTYVPVWQIQFPEGTSADQMAMADHIGKAFQVLILIIAIVLTERENTDTNPNLQPLHK